MSAGAGVGGSAESGEQEDDEPAAPDDGRNELLADLPGGDPPLLAVVRGRTRALH